MGEPIGWVLWRVNGRQVYAQHLYDTERAARIARKRLLLQAKEELLVLPLFDPSGLRGLLTPTGPVSMGLKEG